jgi:hypothetical protein
LRGGLAALDRAAALGVARSDSRPRFAGPVTSGRPLPSSPGRPCRHGRRLEAAFPGRRGPVRSGCLRHQQALLMFWSPVSRLAIGMNAVRPSRDGQSVPPGGGARGGVQQEAVPLAGSLGLGHEMMARSCIALLDDSGWLTRNLNSMNLLGHLGRLVAVGHESTAAIGALPSLTGCGRRSGRGPRQRESGARPLPGPPSIPGCVWQPCSESSAGRTETDTPLEQPVLDPCRYPRLTTPPAPRTRRSSGRMPGAELAHLYLLPE